MSRRINQSQLELFVISYLKRIRTNSVLRRERKFISKAITMITAITTDSPCCQEDLESITLGTPNDNILTNTIRILVDGINRRKWSESIARTIELLKNTLVDPCCYSQEIIFNISVGNGFGFNIIFYDNLNPTRELGRSGEFITNAQPYQKIFNIVPATQYKICIEVLANSATLNMDVLNLENEVLIELPATVGITTCTTDIPSTTVSYQILIAP